MVPSIIIPVYREEDGINDALLALEGLDRIDEAEVVVVDGSGGSTLSAIRVDTLRLVKTESPPGRGIQLNRGAEAASGDAYIFLHVDTRLPPEGIELVRTTLENYEAGAFDLRIVSTHPFVRLTSFVGSIRSRITRVPYGDQAQFIRRETFERIGGFPDYPIMEDVALMDRLKNRGVPIRILPACASTSGRRWETEGALRGTLRNWRLISAYRRGVPVEDLLVRYKPQSELGPPKKTLMPANARERRLIVFYRALVPGKVKTRLASEIGADKAVAAYRAMLVDLRHNIAGLEATLLPMIDRRPRADDDLPFGPAELQRGADLFERMSNSFSDAFQGGAETVVLIGSDIPELSAAIIERFFSALEDHEACLGPTSDGGYYLVGFRRTGFLARAFAASKLTPRHPQPRGSATEATSVYRLTHETLRAAGRSVWTGPALRDVDNLEDLKTVVRGPATETRGAFPHLRRFASELGVAIDE